MVVEGDRFDVVFEVSGDDTSGGKQPRRADARAVLHAFRDNLELVPLLGESTANPLVLAAVQQVIIPDQGTRKVRDEPGFAAPLASTPTSGCWPPRPPPAPTGRPSTGSYFAAR